VARDRSGKRAKARAGELPGRHPKTLPAAGDHRDERPIFSFEHIDRRADERWRFLPERIDAEKLVEFVCTIAGSTWADIATMQTGGNRRLRLHHEQEIATLDKQAQADLSRSKLDERFGDSMFRFRLGSTIRLWGFREGATFHIVWWDDDHNVYPTDPS